MGPYRPHFHIRSGFPWNPVDEFFGSGIDIEALHSEIESKLLDALARAQTDNSAWLEAIWMHGVYVQLVFVFAATVNLIQNGLTKHSVSLAQRALFVVLLALLTTSCGRKNAVCAATDCYGRFL